MEMSHVNRREHIIWHTIDLINEYGIYSVSTKVLAKRLGVSEGTVFKYFSKKNDLLLAVLEQFAAYDHDIFITAQNKKIDPKEAILFYIDAYLVYYENYPAVTALIQVEDVLCSQPELKQKAYDIFYKRFNDMKALIEAAQKANVLSSTTDADLLADLFVSTFRGICIRWRMGNFEFSLREKVSQAVVALIEAFAPV